MRYLARGFTMIELMTTLVVVAIAVSIAIPSFKSQIVNNRSVALGEDIASAINAARAEAVKRADRAAICASKSGTDCDGTWTDGFILFIDAAKKDKEATPTVKTVLKVWPQQDSAAVITVKSDSEDVTFIRYTSLGTLARVKDKPIEILAHLKKCTGNAARKISVGFSGLVSVERKECDS
ncbi:MAG: GspH/FimT family pseudopilin [Cellvibrio sp.]|uniref:GspH/FimT family pseudopilin n=1 Tax=Cellvibrio sp. TaxID=1965322 RepID=UPI0031A77C39